VIKRCSVLLLLVAFLIPVRGALAAVGLFCHVDHSRLEAAMETHQHDATHHAAQHQFDGARHQHSTAHDVPSQTDTCKYCAAVCSVPPVAPAELTLHEPDFAGGERFAAVSVLPPGPFVSGLERPPRTI
jgi:hypothetical protein